MIDIVFGWRTAVLSVAALIILPLAGALWRSPGNRTAAKILAACLVVTVGVFTPWLIGFAGFYDQWRWLTFAPFANALFVPALLYLHAEALTKGKLPPRSGLHLIPGALQFLYQSVCFLLPLSTKLVWADRSLRANDAVFDVLLAGSFLLYGEWTRRSLQRYRAAIIRLRTDDVQFAVRWTHQWMRALAVMTCVWVGFALWDAILPLGYFRLMPLHIAIAGFALYLGITGWRYIALPFPVAATLPDQGATPLRDWRLLGQEWADRTIAGEWYRDEALTLQRLATLLGTNASYLSRALNEGLGVGFSVFINNLRSDAVADALRRGDRRPMLDLAHEAGFASKASFNRCFHDRFGASPSEMRRRLLSDPTPSTTDS